jgi:hypothetical protein
MKRFLCVFLLLLSGLVGCANQGNRQNNAATSTNAHTATPTSYVNRMLEQLATTYYQAIQAQNYPPAYTYLDARATDAAGRTITLKSFEQMAQGIDAQEGPVTSFSLAVYPPTIIMQVTRTFQGAYHVHLQARQVGETWKITALDHI